MIDFRLYLSIRDLVLSNDMKHTLYLFAILALFSCGSRQVVTVLDEVEAVVNEQPDSALFLLKSIDVSNLKTRPLKARYSLLHAMALDKNYIDTTDVSVVMPAVEYYSKHGKPDEKLKAYFYLGRIQFNGDDLNAAAISYSKSEHEADKVADAKVKGLLYMNFADVFSKVRDREKEEEYLRKGIDAFDNAGDLRYSRLSSGRLALLYYGKRDLHLADSLFRDGIVKAKDDTVAMAGFLSNYARLRVVQPDKDPEGAIDLLRRMRYDYCQPFSLLDYGVYAYASLLLGNEKMCSDIEDKFLKPNCEDNKELYYWLSLIEEHRGNYSSALLYSTKSCNYSLAVMNRLLSHSVEQALQEYYALEVGRTEREARASMYYAISAFIFILILISHVIGYFAWKRHKQEIRMKEKINLLRDSCASIYKGRFLILGSLCNDYMSSKNRTDQKEYLFRRVEGYVSEICNDEKSYAKLEKTINKELDNIIKRLKTDLGEVEEQEERLICYCIAGFDAVMIASLLKTSEANVYTRKSRLKKRIRGISSSNKEEYLSFL